MGNRLNDVEATINSFYIALRERNIEKILCLCVEDVKLDWASFTFKGREEVRRWATEFIKEFPNYRFIGSRPTVEEGKAVHKFRIALPTPNQIGLIPVEVTYEFADSKIRNIFVKVFVGTIMANPTDFV